MSKIKALSRFEPSLLNLLRVIDNSPGGLNLVGRKIKRESVLVEFGSPNIAKPLHMGHLRSTVTGHYVARICKHAGHYVTSMCFLGDWGSQFALLQAGLVQWLDPSESIESSVEKMDIQSLLKYYIRAAKEKETNAAFAQEIRKYSLALETSDPSAVKIWSKIREKTLDHLRVAWKQFGINFDIIQGESEFAMKSKQTGEVLKVLEAIGLVTTDPDGCIYALLPSSSKEAETMRVPLVTAEGGSLYLLRDIGAAKSRSENYKFDRMIYIVDKSQSQHFVNLFNVIKNFGYESVTSATAESESEPSSSRKVQHVSFGRIEGMSTRSGNFLLLSDALHDGKNLMEAVRKDSPNTRWSEDESISLQLALSALIVHSLKRRRHRDFKFDWAEAIRPTGETGVRLQYTHARIKSLEEKQGFDPEVLRSPEAFFAHFDADYIQTNSIAMDLTLHLASFEESFWSSYDEFEPCILLTYLFKLCNKTSKALKELQVKTESNAGVAQSHLTLFALSRRILAIGMDTLGLKPLDQI